MRLVERLQQYLAYYNITAYAFEHSCELSNGYLSKQLKGKGAIGSDILERIKQIYTDLSLIWLVTGKGSMLLKAPGEQSGYGENQDLNEEQQLYLGSKDEIIKLLKKQVEKLESTITDKDKIIELMEEQMRRSGEKMYKKAR